MTRARRLLLAPLTTLALLLPADGALAHDQLVGTQPADGAVVDSVDQVTLSFSGALSTVGAQVSLTGGGGTSSLVSGAPRVEGSKLVQGTKPLKPGDYEVMWRVTSEDGHPVSGAFGFHVAGKAASTRADVASSSAATASASTAASSSTPAATAPATASSADQAAATTSMTPAGGELVTPEPDPDGAPTWAFGAGALALLLIIGSAVLWWRSRPPR